MTRRFLSWLGAFPSTNGRIVVGLALAIATGVRVVALGWTPPDSWLIFLAGLAAIEVAQFTAKRVTASEYKPAGRDTGFYPAVPPVPPPSGGGTGTVGPLSAADASHGAGARTATD